MERKNIYGTKERSEDMRTRKGEKEKTKEGQERIEKQTLEVDQGKNHRKSRK